MGKRGPPPDPSVIQMLKGNPSKKGVNRDEPTPDAVSSDYPAPPELEGRPAEIWRDFVRTASNMRVLTQADLLTIGGIRVVLGAFDEGSDVRRRVPDRLSDSDKYRAFFTLPAPKLPDLHYR